MANNLVVGAAVSYNTAGKFGQSLSSGWARTNAVVGTTSAGVGTFEIWVKSTATTTTQVALSSNGSQWLGSANGVAKCGLSSGDIVSSVNICDGAWHHLSLNLDAAGARFYVDGVLAGSNAAQSSLLGNAFTVRTLSNAGNFLWVGEVDEVAIYSATVRSGAFTAPTAATSNAATSILALYHLDGDLTDSAGLVAPAASAVTLSLSATSGVVGSPVTITIGTDQPLTGTQSESVAVTSSIAGTITGSPVTLNSTTATATVTFTPSATGTATITGTATGTPTLTNGTATYTATATANALTNATANLLFSPYNWNLGVSTAKTINAGAYFKTIFTGTTCTLQFDMTNLLAPFPQIAYRIDGTGAWNYATLAASVALTLPTGTSDYATKGGHLLEVVVKSMTETQARWTTQATAVSLTGIILDASATLAKPPSHPLNALFYGDSITEGVRTLNSTATNDTDRNDSMQGWAYHAARLLNAEIGVVGFGGTGFTLAGSGSVPALPATYNLLYSGVSRSFATAPDFIVLMEGTNDGATDVTTAATTVLNGLIAATPATTKIIVLRPFNGTAHSSQLQAAIAASTTPSRCVFIDTAGWFNTANSADTLHPYGNENLTHIAPLCATAIRPYVVTASIKPATSKTISVTFQNRAGAAQANLTGLKWEWSDMLGVVIDSGSGATTNASGVFSVTSVRTNLAAAGIGYLKVTNSNGTVNTTDVSFEGAVAVA